MKASVPISPSLCDVEKSRIHDFAIRRSRRQNRDKACYLKEVV
ncbi:MAG: hypothetical protein Q8P88_02195 [Candidatus Jorgensenbacteria bacterium]|nr:hypothetical protein [Candidatus Jorgensenbacteria bacterium]